MPVSGNHAIGTVRKFPTLPLNSNGVWIDPTGGVWRQANAGATASGKDHIADYAQIAAGDDKKTPGTSLTGASTGAATTGVAAASGHGDYER